MTRLGVVVAALSMPGALGACSGEDGRSTDASRERGARADTDTRADAESDLADEPDASAATDAASSSEPDANAAPSATGGRDAADSGSRAEEPDASAPATSTSGGCPVHVSVVTASYGTGNNDDDDYAPNNVGAVWITDSQGAFIRTIAVWGPGYWNFAETWVKQSGGSRVDIVSGATRKNHEKPVQADWDCTDKNGARVPAGTYRLNVEFTEAEMQGPLLTRDSSLPFTLGDDAKGATRAPGNSFGPIDVRVTP